MKYFKNIALIVFCFFALSAFAQNDSINKKDAAGKKQGHWIKLDDNKKKIYDGNFVNDIPVGKFTYYYDNGTPWSETVFTKNGKVAYTKMFDAGGKLMGEGKYIDQKKDSLWKFYNNEGKLISDEMYTNGLKNGSCKVYYANAQISEEKIWKNGVLDGTCKKYFETGQIKYLGQYINNKVEGKAVFYHTSGKVNAEGLYKADLKDGDWKYYKEDGTLDRIDPYIEGRFVGKKDPNVISKEQEEKEKKQYENFEIKDPYQEGYTPH
jgi:antitoxin component YwqK of YwqJK toxin-antitoxin module